MEIKNLIKKLLSIFLLFFAIIGGISNLIEHIHNHDTTRSVIDLIMMAVVFPLSHWLWASSKNN